MSCRHADSGSAVLVSGGGRRLASRLEAHFTSLESAAAMSWRLRRDAITGARDLLTSQLRHVWCARSRCSRDSRKRIRSSDVRRVRLASNQARPLQEHRDRFELLRAHLAPRSSAQRHASRTASKVLLVFLGEFE